MALVESGEAAAVAGLETTAPIGDTMASSARAIRSQFCPQRELLLGSEDVEEVHGAVELAVGTRQPIRVAGIECGMGGSTILRTAQEILGSTMLAGTIRLSDALGALLSLEDVELAALGVGEVEFLDC